MALHRVIMLGAPGSGKGTQAKFLMDKLDLVHISSGDLFREAQEKGTELGRLAKSYMEKGELVPDDITTKMAVDRILSLKDEGFVLDGFPRNLNQARALDEALEKENMPMGLVIYLKVPRDILLRRLSGRRTCRNCGEIYNVYTLPPKVEGRCDKCGGELYQRTDDNEETVRHRIEVYARETQPLVEYYQHQGKLSEIESKNDVNMVRERLLALLK
jgi:adenylate kinase